MKGLLAWNQETKTCCPKRRAEIKGKKRRRDFSHKVETIDEDSQSETVKIRKEGAAMGRFKNRFLKKYRQMYERKLTNCQTFKIQSRVQSSNIALEGHVPRGDGHPVTKQLASGEEAQTRQSVTFQRRALSSKPYNAECPCYPFTQRNQKPALQRLGFETDKEKDTQRNTSSAGTSLQGSSTVGKIKRQLQL